jgi:hypothetical protein
MEKKRGGVREGAGRKPKAEERTLIEKFSPLEPLAFLALEDALKNKKDWAVKLTFEYLYGKPKQQIDQTTNLNVNDFSIKDLISFDKDKQ